MDPNEPEDDKEPADTVTEALNKDLDDTLAAIERGDDPFEDEDEDEEDEEEFDDDDKREEDDD